MKKPFNTYNGGKAGNGTYQQIINHIPQCDIFIDAMVGNGGIVTNLALPSLTVINDIDRSVIDEYDVISCTTTVIKRNQCYSGLIDEFGDNTRCVMYFDPPYLFETRRSQKSLYNYEWIRAQHVTFLTAAATARCSIIISHYPCELYDNMLKGWYTHDFESMTRNGLRTERIYMNYPPPVILQDFRYLGKDYRERQRIKRKIDRHLNKLESLPADERTAILSSIIVRYSATAAHFVDQDHNVEIDGVYHTDHSDDVVPSPVQSKMPLMAMETFLINPL